MDPGVSVQNQNFTGNTKELAKVPGTREEAYVRETETSQASLLPLFAEVRRSSSVCSSKCRRGKKKERDGEGQVEVEGEDVENQGETHMDDYADDMRLKNTLSHEVHMTQHQIV